MSFNTEDYESMEELKTRFNTEGSERGENRFYHRAHGAEREKTVVRVLT